MDRSAHLAPWQTVAQVHIEGMDADELAQCIKQQRPGWEAAWQTFSGLLMERVQASLRSTFQYSNNLGGLATMDDVVQDLWLRWDGKARAGTLLKQWNRGPALSYLVGSATRHEALRRALRYAAQSKQSSEQGHALETHAATSPVADVERERETAGNLAPDLKDYDGPWHFLPISNGPDQPHLMAGVQLLGTLDWQGTEATAVRNGLPGYLHPCGATWPEQAAQSWRHSRNTLWDDVENLRETVTTDAVTSPNRINKRLQRRLIRSFACYRFAPIAATEVMRLTGNQRNTADKHISRYRKALPTLLRELAELANGSDSDRDDELSP